MIERESIECNFAHLRKVEVCFTYFATESEIELIRDNTTFEPNI